MMEDEFGSLSMEGERWMVCPLSKEALLVLVKEEARRRLSPEFLLAVEEEERQGQSDGTDTILRMQEEVVRQAGHPPEVVEVLRSARLWYPGVHEFWEVPVQVRENVMRDGILRVGEDAPNLELFTLEGTKRQLFPPEGVTVLLAGSYS